MTNKPTHLVRVKGQPVAVEQKGPVSVKVRVLKEPKLSNELKTITAEQLPESKLAHKEKEDSINNSPIDANDVVFSAEGPIRIIGVFIEGEHYLYDEVKDELTLNPASPYITPPNGNKEKG